MVHRRALFIFLAVLPSALGLGEFLARCPNNRRAQDDPLVYPGEPGVSHMHDFFGAEGVNAFSTVETIPHSATGCDPTLDHSSYWTPSLIYNGAYHEPERTTFYYHTFNNHNQVQPLPLGFAMISRSSSFSCFGGNTGNNPEDPSIPNCGNGKLQMFINFQQCWDGINYDSPNHETHVAFANGGNCPASHPVLIPRVQIILRFALPGGPGTSLSSGSGYTAHADFVNGWEPAAMTLRLNQCLRADTKCDENLPGDAGLERILGNNAAPTESGNPISIPPTQLPEDPDDPEIIPPTTAELPPDTTEVIAEADTFVRGGAFGNENFAENTELTVKKANVADFQRETYIRFNLAGLPGSITSCQLRLDVNTDLSGPQAFTFKIGRLQNNNWQEETLTANNAPASTLLGQVQKAANQNVVEYSLLEQCRAAVAAADKRVSIRVYYDEGPVTDNIYFYSREAGTLHAPRLVIGYTPGTEAAENGSSVLSVVFSLVVAVAAILA